LRGHSASTVHSGRRCPRFAVLSYCSDTLLMRSRRPRSAQATLRAAGGEDEAARLDGVTWHALRYTFASRLVAAGVDLRTVQELGGWRTLSMVQRSHLSPSQPPARSSRIPPWSSRRPQALSNFGKTSTHVETAICDEEVRD